MKKTLTSMWFILGVWALLVIGAGAWNMLQATPTAAVPDVVTAQPIVCQPIAPVSGDKTIILRVDDVQAYAWPTTTRLMVDDALERNLPLTLGVIPNLLRGDVSLVRFLQERACNLEFALHGFDHQSYGDAGQIAEFELLSESAAQERLAAGLEELQAVTSKPILTWIPPLNKHSTGTRDALIGLGITRWSTEGQGKWDYDAATFSYDDDALTAAEVVVAQCADTFIENDVCIIMLHPQDFTTADGEHDAEVYDAYYLDLLDRLYGEGYGFGTFASVAG